MRSSGVTLYLLACFSLAGCTSNSSVDDLAPRPSYEVTSSIESEAASPSNSVAPSQGAEIDELIEAAGPDETGRLPVEAAALVAPKRPIARPQPIAVKIERHRFRDAKPMNFGKVSPKSSRSMGSMYRAGKARSTGRNFAGRAPTSSISRPRTAATISIRCSRRTGARRPRQA